MHRFPGGCSGAVWLIGGTSAGWLVGFLVFVVSTAWSFRSVVGGAGGCGKSWRLGGWSVRNTLLGPEGSRACLGLCLFLSSCVGGGGGCGLGGVGGSSGGLSAAAYRLRVLVLFSWVEVGSGFSGLAWGWWMGAARMLRTSQWTRASLWRQATKSTWWMPWHQEPMKDVGACDKPRGVGNRAVIRGCPNGETQLEESPVTGA